MSSAGMTIELGNYIQFPRLVLLRDPLKAQSTECAICQDYCHYRPEKNDKADSMAILPCGHVFCKDCVEKALESKLTCPTCRMSLEYRSCKHSVKPRVLHEESVLILPDTVRSSDQLPECCPSCRRAAAVKHASKLFSMFRREIDEASQAFQDSKSDDDREKLSAADQKAHRILLSSFNIRAQFDW